MIWFDFGSILVGFGLIFVGFGWIFAWICLDFGFHSVGFWAILVPAALTSSLGGPMTRSEVPGLAHCTRDGPPKKFLGVLRRSKRDRRRS